MFEVISHKACCGGGAWGDANANGSCLVAVGAGSDEPPSKSPQSSLSSASAAETEEKPGSWKWFLDGGCWDGPRGAGVLARSLKKPKSDVADGPGLAGATDCCCWRGGGSAPNSAKRSADIVESAVWKVWDGKARPVLVQEVVD